MPTTLHHFAQHLSSHNLGAGRDLGQPPLQCTDLTGIWGAEMPGVILWSHQLLHSRFPTVLSKLHCVVFAVDGPEAPYTLTLPNVPKYHLEWSRQHRPYNQTRVWIPTPQLPSYLIWDKLHELWASLSWVGNMEVTILTPQTCCEHRLTWRRKSTCYIALPQGRASTLNSLLNFTSWLINSTITCFVGLGWLASQKPCHPSPMVQQSLGNTGPTLSLRSGPWLLPGNPFPLCSTARGVCIRTMQTL